PLHGAEGPWINRPFLGWEATVNGMSRDQIMQLVETVNVFLRITCATYLACTLHVGMMAAIDVSRRFFEFRRRKVNQT
ncbi:MAG: hypothetical protein KDA42_19220, partial [Planctomycetales bacterium]|nr:hypothetical protein [Planctomycetales bacterium]